MPKNNANMLWEFKSYVQIYMVELLDKIQKITLVTD